MYAYKHIQQHINNSKEKDMFSDEMLNSLYALQVESFLGQGYLIFLYFSIRRFPYLESQKLEIKWAIILKNLNISLLPHFICLFIKKSIIKIPWCLYFFKWEWKRWPCSVWVALIALYFNNVGAVFYIILYLALSQKACFRHGRQTDPRLNFRGS